MKLRELARTWGIHHSAIGKGCRTRRLNRSVTRDARGRVVDIDPVMALQEWNRGAARLPMEAGALATRLARPGKKRGAVVPVEMAPILELHGLAEITQPGGPALVIRFGLDRFVAGAAKALQEAGQVATPDQLRAVIESKDDAWWWETAIGALAAAVDVTAGLPLMWEASGREAVHGEAEGGSSDGSA